MSDEISRLQLIAVQMPCNSHSILERVGAASKVPVQGEPEGETSSVVVPMKRQDDLDGTHEDNLTARLVEGSDTASATEKASKEMTSTSVNSTQKNASSNASSNTKSDVGSCGRSSGGKTKEDREAEFQEMLRKIDREASAAKAAQGFKASTTTPRSPAKPIRADEPLVSLTDESDEDTFELLPSFARALLKQ